MNTSKLKRGVYGYLGFRGVQPDAQTDSKIDACLKEIEALSHFRYVYKHYSQPLPFLQKQPYSDYLKGSSGVLLSVMTLGGEIDRRINFYGRTDAFKAVVFDACASAYLEELSDGYERGIADNLSYRFCPGYGGSSVDDLEYIFRELHPEKIGVTLTKDRYMLPCKTMAGVIAVGVARVKSCKSCNLFEHCLYRKEGVTCYNPKTE